jgi:glutathione S-transferase
MTTVTLGYWKLRGLGQTIRLLLSYTDTPFTEVQYEFATKEQWFEQDKKNLGLDFPNIPYLIDGDFKLTESSAIAKYIIKRSGRTDLLGKTLQDEGLVENLIGVLNDALKEMRSLFGNPHWEHAKNEIFPKIKPKIEYLKEFVGDREYALGYLTLADFYLAEYLYFFETLFPAEHRHYAFWWRIRHNFEELAGVKAYYLRPDAVVEPFVPPFLPLQPRYKRVKLAYWSIRGLAQVPRLLLAYSGVHFEDYQYQNPDQWFKEDKLHLGLDFPNLPYLTDGEFNITESSAIQRYIIDRWGKSELLGRTIQDNAKLESFLSIFTEFAGAVKGLFFNKDWETAKAAVIEKYRPKLQQLEKFVGANKFVLGYLTLADFVVAEDSHYIERLFPEDYKTFSFLGRIREEFNQVPEVVKYYEQPTAFKGRFFPEYAAVSIEQ